MTLLDRENVANRTGERWRPPEFEPVHGRRQRLTAATRRFFDLQAGSIWRDLKALLAAFDGAVVDAGCGAQPYRPLLSGARSYVGIDLDRAGADFGYSIPDVLRISDAGRWPVDDAGTDLVLATEVLEHVPEPSQFLAEAYRCLRPGGSLILTIPFAARWHYVPHDYWRFTPSALRLLLEHVGFEDIYVYARGNETTVALYKLLGLLLPLALPQGERSSAGRRARGLLLAPLIAGLAVAGNMSMAGRAGEDCLGYTACAVRPPEPRGAAG